MVRLFVYPQSGRESKAEVCSSVKGKRKRAAKTSGAVHAAYVKAGKGQKLTQKDKDALARHRKGG